MSDDPLKVYPPIMLFAMAAAQSSRAYHARLRGATRVVPIYVAMAERYEHVAEELVAEALAR